MIARLTTRQAAELLGISPATMARWRCHGTGPIFLRVGPRRVAYLLTDVQAFLAENRRRTTKERALVLGILDEEADQRS